MSNQITKRPPMQVKALYDNGHLIFLDKALPPGTMEVTVDIPDDKIPELSEEFKQELETRLSDYKKGAHEAVDGPQFLNQLREKYS